MSVNVPCLKVRYIAGAFCYTTLGGVVAYYATLPLNPRRVAYYATNSVWRVETPCGTSCHSCHGSSLQCGTICHITSQPTPCGILCHKLCLTRRNTLWHIVPQLSRLITCSVACYATTTGFACDSLSHFSSVSVLHIESFTLTSSTSVDLLNCYWKPSGTFWTIIKAANTTWLVIVPIYIDAERLCRTFLSWR